jgi:uncharacterized protein involved in cysteine biosynthesis
VRHRVKAWYQRQSYENQNLMFGLMLTACWAVPCLLLFALPIEKGGC